MNPLVLKRKHIEIIAESDGDGDDGNHDGGGGGEQKKVVPPTTTVRTIPGWEPITNHESFEQRAVHGLPGLRNVYVRECGGGGDCLFYAVAVGYHLALDPTLSRNDIRLHKLQWMEEARDWAARGISPANIDGIVKAYQSEWFAHRTWKKYVGTDSPFHAWPENPSTWDPSVWGGEVEYKFGNTNDIPQEVRGKVVRDTLSLQGIVAKFLDIHHPQFLYSKAAKEFFQTHPVESTTWTETEKRQWAARLFKTHAFQTIVRTRGNTFRGDENALDWMIQGNSMNRRIGFIILNDNGTMTCTFFPSNRRMDEYMLLFNIDQTHWQLVGIWDDAKQQMRSVFPADHLPDIVFQLWKSDCVASAREAKEVDPWHPFYTRVRPPLPPSSSSIITPPPKWDPMALS